MLETRMVPGQYIVKVSSDDREDFINYIVDNYNLKLETDIDEMINNKFPFVVDFNINLLWVCDSITCLACATQKGLIITVNDFLKQMKSVL